MVSTPDTRQLTTTTVNTAVTAATPTNGGCSFTWASRDLTELTNSFDSSLQALHPQSSGNAYAYGEDCVFANGTSRFTAMETDFRVRTHVTDLQDTAQIGNSIMQTMKVVAAIPAQQLSGPKSGRVDFEFYAGETEALRLGVGIDEYRAIAPGTSGAEIYRLFYRVR